jgi:hypothetical protein
VTAVGRTPSGTVVAGNVRDPETSITTAGFDPKRTPAAIYCSARVMPGLLRIQFG